MGWFEDRIDRIMSGSRPTVVAARPSYGVTFLFGALQARQYACVWITLANDDDVVSIGNKLSDAVRYAFGATLFGAGMPYSYALRYLVGLTNELGPLTLLVDEAHCSPEFSRAAMVASIRAQGRLKVVIAGHGANPAWQAVVVEFGQDLVSERELEVMPAEAVNLLSGTRSLNADGDNETVGQPYTSIIAKLSPVGPQKWNPGAGASVQPQRAEKSNLDVDALIGSGNWRAAFEAAVRVQPRRAVDLLVRAADAYFAQGQLVRFLHFVSKLLTEFPDDPDVMYWWFQAHVALGRRHEVDDRVARFLEFRERDAPTLAAAYASVARPPDAMDRAVRAVENLRAPETVATLGFLRVAHGDLEAGISLLREAYDGFRAERRHHKAIQLSNSIGSAYVQTGDYRRALVWAQSSVDELHRRDIREELLRLSCVNLLSYTHLLIGNLEAGEEELKKVQLSVGGDTPIPPTLEGLVSTFGDFAMVRGQPNEALRYYRELYRQLAYQLPGHAARYYVRGLIAVGRQDDAIAVTAVSTELHGALDEIERANLDIAHVLVKAHEGAQDVRTAEALADNSVVKADAVLRAELVLALAMMLDRKGDTSAAVALMRRHRDILMGLGRTGWILLSPPGTDVDRLRRHLTSEAGSSTRVSVLGAREIARDGVATSLSMRFAELITVLALSPDGLSGEALLYEVYGDVGQMSTLKATVSRARRHVAVDSVPYRLAEDLYVDVVEFERYLRSGELRKAMELYKGPLLPESEAPGIRRARERIDEAVRQAVLHSGEADLALRLARKFPDDLELWEKAEEWTPTDDPAYPLIRAQIRRIRGEWGL